jgi:hypothetical protein
MDHPPKGINKVKMPRMVMIKHKPAMQVILKVKSELNHVR